MKQNVRENQPGNLKIEEPLIYYFSIQNEQLYTNLQTIGAKKITHNLSNFVFMKQKVRKNQPILLVEKQYTSHILVEPPAITRVKH